jgi:hypothetical protein
MYISNQVQIEKDIQSDGRLGLLALSLEDGTKTSLQRTLENFGKLYLFLLKLARCHSKYR